MSDFTEDDSPILDIDKEGGEGGGAAAEQKVEEHLSLQSGFDGRKVWLVKVPKFLQERWNEQKEAGVHLATMRVYHPVPGAQANKVQLLLPSQPSYKTDDLPAEFDLIMAPEKNEEGEAKRGGFVLSERKVEGGRVHPTLFARVHHEASLQPVHSPQYRALVRKRQAAADKPKRTLQMLDEEGLGAGQMAQMASGVAVSAAEKSKGRFQIKQPPKKSLDKATRLPRNELLDLLFSLFETHQYWSLKGLKEKTRQPETYLKEVLTDVGVMIKRGPYTGTWALMEVYKSKKENAGDVKGEGKEEVKGEGSGGVGGASGSGAVGGSGGGMGEEEDEEDEEEEDDEDMEEV